MHDDPDGLQAWARRWDVSDQACAHLRGLAAADGAVPPLTGMPAEVTAELQLLPLRALGQLRDLFLPDLYPQDAAPGRRVDGPTAEVSSQ